jgi:hypothetical protein
MIANGNDLSLLIGLIALVGFLLVVSLGAGKG